MSLIWNHYIYFNRHNLFFPVSSLLCQFFRSARPAHPFLGPARALDTGHGSFSFEEMVRLLGSADWITCGLPLWLLQVVRYPQMCALVFIFLRPAHAKHSLGFWHGSFSLQEVVWQFRAPHYVLSLFQWCLALLDQVSKPVFPGLSAGVYWVSHCTSRQHCEPAAILDIGDNRGTQERRQICLRKCYFIKGVPISYQRSNAGHSKLLESPGLVQDPILGC